LNDHRLTAGTFDVAMWKILRRTPGRSNRKLDVRSRGELVAKLRTEDYAERV
jgi:hypothetical protein